MSKLIDAFLEYQSRLAGSLVETFYMVLISFIASLFLGTILGIIVALTSKNRPYQNKALAYPLQLIINFVKSVPFMLLMIIMVPVSRFIIGTGYGIYASMISLTLIGVSIIARQVEQVIIDVNPNLFDIGKSFGFNKLQTIYHIILVEARAPLMLGYTASLISLIAYSTVVGVVNGGGIGTLALTDGVGLWRYDLIIIIIIILVIIVGIIQFIGNLLANILNKKAGKI